MNTAMPQTALFDNNQTNSNSNNSINSINSSRSGRFLGEAQEGVRGYDYRSNGSETAAQTQERVSRWLDSPPGQFFLANSDSGTFMWVLHAVRLAGYPVPKRDGISGCLFVPQCVVSRLVVFVAH